MWTAAPPCAPESASQAGAIDGEKRPSFTQGEVHVWLCPLPTGEPERESALLGPEESARATSFRTAPLRRAYVSAHGALRSILASYVGDDPRRLRFTHNDWGKPALAEGGPHFNLSHSGDFALLAISPAGPVGVDIEKMLPDAPLSIAPLAFTLIEQAMLAASDRGRRDVFYDLWTRKEALAKGIGRGFSVDPLAMTVIETVRQVGSQATLSPELASAGTWHLFPIPAVTGYAAALATQDSQSKIILKHMTSVS